MFDAVVVVGEGGAGVVGRVDVDALHLAGELGFEGFEGEEVVAEDEAVVELVGGGHALRRGVAEGRIFEEDARLQLRPHVLPDPSEFELRFFHGFLERSAAFLKRGVYEIC